MVYLHFNGPLIIIHVLVSVWMIWQGRFAGNLCQNCFNPDAHPLVKFKLKWPPITRSASSRPGNPTEKQDTLDPGGYSHTLPIQVCAAQRGRDFKAPDLEWGIHFRGVF